MLAEKELKIPDSKISLIRDMASKLNLIRTRQRAFHPHGDQEILILSPQVFTVLRRSPEGDQHILTMTNISNKICTIEILLSDLNIDEENWYDMINEKEWIFEKKKLSITMQPYDVIWLKPVKELNKRRLT